MRQMTREELRAELGLAATEILKRGRQVSKRLPGTRYVYVISAKDKTATKIGVATNVGRRRATLQTGCPHKLRIHLKALCPVGTELEVESACHAALRNHRLAGEWFAVTPEHAATIVLRELERFGGPAAKPELAALAA